MGKLTPVAFTKSWRGYSAGDTAGFTAEQAEKLIDAGVAVMPGKVPVNAKTSAKLADPGPAASPEAAQDEQPDEKP